MKGVKARTNISKNNNEFFGKKQLNIKKFLKDNYTGWLFNFPLFFGLLVFTFIPVGYSLYFSFNKDVWVSNGNISSVFVGLGNYVKIFTRDKDILNVVKNTIVYTAISIPLNLVLSYFLALLVNTKVKGVGAFRIMYYLPCMIPAVVSGLLWKDMFDQTFGIFNKILGLFSIGPSEFFNSTDTSTAMSSIFLMNLWSIGGGMILWLSAFKNIGKHYYEAASLDGANVWQRLANITIPMSTSMIFFNVVMSVIGTLQYNGTLLFAPLNGKGNENSIYMYAVKIYREGFVRGDIGYACALAWLLLFVISIITALLFSTSKWVFYGEDA